MEVIKRQKKRIINYIILPRCRVRNPSLAAFLNGHLYILHYYHIAIVSCTLQE